MIRRERRGVQRSRRAALVVLFGTGLAAVLLHAAPTGGVTISGHGRA